MKRLTPEQRSIIAEKMPGEDYIAVLKRLHEFLEPYQYLEIGVNEGLSLSLSLPDTYAIGVDPQPCIKHSLQAWTKIFQMTSEQFFKIYEGTPFNFIFIDGFHQYDFVINDFIESEKLCTPHSLIAIHDTIPITSETALEMREGHWTGDVWKIVPALIHERHDLTIFTISCRPSGLTIIMNFSKPLGLSKQTIDLFRNKNFEWLEKDWKKLLNVVPNNPLVWFPLIKKHLF